jgi:hypothetical protein
MLVSLLAGGCDLPPIISVIPSEAKDICIPVKAGSRLPPAIQPLIFLITSCLCVPSQTSNPPRSTMKI